MVRKKIPVVSAPYKNFMQDSDKRQDYFLKSGSRKCSAMLERKLKESEASVSWTQLQDALGLGKWEDK